MHIPLDVLAVVVNIQESNPEFLLCGSVALIMCGLLDNRPVHDIDFVANKMHMFESNLNFKSDPYSQLNKKDGYRSFSCLFPFGSNKLKINLLAFDDDYDLCGDEYMVDGLVKVKHQRLQDIINWKEKYNRIKDKRDLENILSKAVEEAFLKEKT